MSDAGASAHDTYTSPLVTRNASEPMRRLWSARARFQAWRRVWVAVATAQHELGLGVSAAQAAALRATVERPGGITDDEIASAERYERTLRHDVMAHVHALGEACPEARPVIHLAMTSQDVVCNADVQLVRRALRLVEGRCLLVRAALAGLARRHARTAALGFTHFQAAQPTTVGRRAAQWAHDLELCERRIRALLSDTVRYRGLRGATGTQASYLALAGGDAGLVDRLEARAMALFTDGEDPGAPGVFACSTQTYPRVVDAFVLSELAACASTLHKMATDIRLLCHLKEVDEPFEDRQIGSSAMPYKRNPMRCERLCGLARFVVELAGNALHTSATQWLERSLDDSSNRRLSIPEAFLALDGALVLARSVAAGLVVHEAQARAHLEAELPFLATEEILLACVRAGGDRQAYHERLRVHAQAAGQRVKQEGAPNDLLDRLRADPAFRGRDHGGPLAAELDWELLMDPARYTGRAAEQAEAYAAGVLEGERSRIEALGALAGDLPAV